MTRFTSLVLALGIWSTAASAEDVGAERLDQWHHWRGPHATGVAPKANPPIMWDAKTNIKWKVELPGRGSATPIVWGDDVFLVSAIKTDRLAEAKDLPKPDPRFETKTSPPRHYYQFVVVCYDRATGKERWKRVAAEKVPHEGHHTTHSYAAGSPTTDGKRLYVSFGSFGIFCYDFTGKLLWSRELGAMHTRLGWGEAVTPTLAGDHLLLNWDQETNSALYCLNAKTGEKKWKKEREEKTSWNTPLVVTHQGRTQVILNGTTRVRSYEVDTGNVIWECGGMTTNAIPSIVAADGWAYCLSGYRGAVAFAVSLDAKGDVTNSDKYLWKYDRGTPYVPSPLLLADRLYFTKGNDAFLTILNRKSGKPLVEGARLPGVTTFYGSPVAAAGRIYLTDRSGTTLVLKAGDTVEVLATNRLDDPVDASPVLVGKQLFLRGEKYLYCIEAP